TYNCGDTYIEDATRVGFLHLILSAASITAGTVFTVIVEGKATIPGAKVDEQQSAFLADPTCRILAYTNSNTTYTDHTRFLSRRANPWGNDAINTSA
uniref:hypothetical protein n=1 Tax=Enterococcus faecium TaxID=1352 RepID=UPI0034E93384